MAPARCELALDDRAALGERLLVLLRLEPLPDLGAGAMAVRVAELRIEPVARRPALLRRDDLDALAVLQRVVERHHRAVDARAAAAVAEARVHGVREIDRRRTHRQVDDLALRRQHVDGVGEEAALERGEPLGRVGDRVLPVEHLPQPRDAVLERGIAARALRARPPCTASARRRRIPNAGASRACGSAPRAACPRARSPPCAATGSRWPSASRCSRRTRAAAASTGDGRCRARRSSP